MKRIITLSVILMALCFSIIGVTKDLNKDATHDVSGALDVIAFDGQMAKSAMGGEKIVFSADDFERYLNVAQISSITIRSVPAVTDGCLCIGDVLVNAGQTISGENLDLLNYRVGDEKVKSAFFTFTVGESEYEMRCNMYFLNRENASPTLESENERSFKVSTHQKIKIYGRVGAYDPDGDMIRYEVVSYAKNGVLDFDNETGEYSYTPLGAYFGEDSFEYVAVDEYGNYSGSKKVHLTIQKLEGEQVYCDMTDHVAHHAAIVMAQKGIMGGETVGNMIYFMPDKSVSRADFVVMLMHAIGKGEIEPVADTGFDDDMDIAPSMKGYIKAARDIGMIHGRVNEQGEYLFDPNAPLTRAEAALMVNNIVGGESPIYKPTFSDSGDIPAWASDAIYTLYSMGMLSSHNGEIAASSEISRAQVAQMLCALMDYLN